MRKSQVAIVVLENANHFDENTGKRKWMSYEEFGEKFTKEEGSSKDRWKRRIDGCVQDWLDYVAAEAVLGSVPRQNGPNLCPTWLLKAVLWLRGIRVSKVKSKWLGTHSVVHYY